MDGHGVNSEKINETYRCNYGFDEKFIEELKRSDLKISGDDANKEIRILELINHPFFVATLFQPERAALKYQNHPLIDAFVKACINQKIFKQHELI